MKVLLINGSPHKEGCTYTALTEVAKTLNEENIENKILEIFKKILNKKTINDRIILKKIY